MEKYIVDRFEGDFAVLEKEIGGTVDIKKDLIPGIKEGDAVIFEDGFYHIDRELTEKRKAVIQEKMNKLFGKK